MHNKILRYLNNIYAKEKGSNFRWSGVTIYRGRNEGWNTYLAVIDCTCNRIDTVSLFLFWAVEVG